MTLILKFKLSILSELTMGIDCFPIVNHPRLTFHINRSSIFIGGYQEPIFTICVISNLNNMGVAHCSPLLVATTYWASSAHPLWWPLTWNQSQPYRSSRGDNYCESNTIPAWWLFSLYTLSMVNTSQPLSQPSCGGSHYYQFPVLLIAYIHKWLSCNHLCIDLGDFAHDVLH